MAPKRKSATIGARNRDRASRQSTMRTVKEPDDIPEIYRDMLAEAVRNPLPKADTQTKAVKRRRLDDGSAQVTDLPLSIKDEHVSPLGVVADAESNESAQARQTVFDDFAASDDESDDDFEDVDLAGDAEAGHLLEEADEPLHLNLSTKPGPEAASDTPRRKPATATERRLRLDVHKWHVLCLLGHLQQRNHWCDDGQIQSILKPLIPRKTVKLLHLDSSQSQYQRTHSFNAAIEEISKSWRSKWTVTEQGMSRAFWKEESGMLKNVDDLPDLVDLTDFRDAAKTRSGSRDLGVQLFCTLLRAVAVDTRLVCSLQPLPFSGVAKGTTPGKPRPQYIMASSLGRQPQQHQDADSSTVSNPRRRLYGAQAEPTAPAPSQKPPRRIKDSPYPIFWVEVFNESLHKWIPVDPLVRNTINKPKSGFEPPANDALNNMSYVIAFEDDGSAKDVTRRYVQFYNGKTRRNRVESTKAGKEWWEKTMSFFEKPFPEDRDEIENAELSATEESEQMPKNVQDFKNHPHYSLERHLRRNEVIYPRREIGRVSVGQSKDGKLEPVFRRKDVVIVKTADQWYRLGRDVKIGQQPLKRVLLQKRRAVQMGGEDSEDGGEEGALLYAESQTELYIPPSVVNGKIPKNAYGNLDVYVASMIPAGGIHVRHPDAARAAKILGIGYADAVTGFEFRGRQGTAVLNGIVAAAEYREVIVEVLDGIAYDRALMNKEKRSALALQMWKKFLIALRIRERVATTYAEAGSDTGEEDDEMGDETYQDEDEAGIEGCGGGFFPEQSRETATLAQSPETQPPSVNSAFDFERSGDVDMPVVINESPHKLPPPPQEQYPCSAKREEQDQHGEIPTWGAAFLADYDPSTNEEGGGGFLVDDEGEQPPGPKVIASPSSNPIPPTLGPQHHHPGNPSQARPANTAHSQPPEPDTPTGLTTQKPHQEQPPPAVQPPNSENPPERHTHPSHSSTTIITTPPHPHLLQPDPQQSEPAPHPNDADHAITPIDDGPAGETRDSGSDMDQSSLLSHDPEDEDAEPDWLGWVEDSD